MISIGQPPNAEPQSNLFIVHMKPSSLRSGNPKESCTFSCSYFPFCLPCLSLGHSTGFGQYSANYYLCTCAFDLQPDVCNEASADQVVLRHSSKDVTSSSNNRDSTGHTEEVGVAKQGRITRTSNNPGTSRLKFDDSFYKRARVEMKVDSQDVPDPESVTDIFVPVPASMPPREETLHETITSAYETNLSINKLLRERHKGSLAAMGRFFGTKQKELERQKSAASLIVSNGVDVRCLC